jgi:hypothetical protein
MESNDKKTRQGPTRSGILILATALLLAPRIAHAQSNTTFFPQIADGGPASQDWVTTITLVNPTTTAANVTVNMYGDDGTPMPLDFGNGPVTSFTVTISPIGTATFQSLGNRSQIQTGWAMATSTAQIYGSVMYKYSTNGTPQQGVMVSGIAPSDVFFSPATSTSGVVVVNPNQVSIQIVAVALDSGGGVVATVNSTLPAGTHQSLAIAQLFPGIPANFRGTILAYTPSKSQFVALAISGDGGVISSYPIIAPPAIPSYYYPSVRRE